MANMENEIRVKPGAEFQVNLSEIPGSGHVWQHAATPEGLTYLGASYLDPEPPRAVGSSRRRGFRFRADRPGDFTLSFRLERPWERAPVQQRTIRIPVN
jgi:predicted secreted protein